jgi:hypothetical protein
MESAVAGPGDRRRAARLRTPDAHGIVAARIKPGKEVVIIDVSAGGALVETTHRLLPGAEVELHMETNRQRATVRGRVVRCHVERVGPAAVSYRGGIHFDACLPWFAPDGGSAGYSLLASESRSAEWRRVDAAQKVL